jgi:hypothetical protein
VNQGSRALAAAHQARTTVERAELVIVIHSGPLFLGLVGHPEYARTDIIGATVNTAFLLAPFVAANCASHVGMTRAVLDVLSAPVRTLDVGATSVLGESEPVRVFEPLVNFQG